MMPYERFEAWKATHELALEVYRITDHWPACERYGLTSQTRCVALSAPTTIAEGAAKRGPREFRRFLDIARGSLSELSYLLLFSRDLEILRVSHQSLASSRVQASAADVAQFGRRHLQRGRRATVLDVAPTADGYAATFDIALENV